MPLKINADGTLPMWIDPTDGRRHLEPDVETAVVGGGDAQSGPHNHDGTYAASVHVHNHNHAGVYTEPGHGHAQADVTNLVSDLAGKAPTHSHPYAATSHAHVDGDLPAGLARDSEVAAAYSPLAHHHDAAYSGTAHVHAAYAPTSHSHLDADIPAAIARDSEVTAAIATHASTPHGGSLPAGLIVM